MTALAATVRDNDARHRYELLVDDEVVGELIYRARDSVVTLIHTEIAPEFEGHGLGDQLVATVLDDVRASGRRVVPICPFVVAYLRRHREYQDLVE